MEQIPAGSAMDAEIAQKIFGHEVRLVTENERNGPDGVYLQDVERKWGQSGNKFWGSLTCYSTNIAAAMLVFDHLVGLGLQVILARDSLDEPYEVEVCTSEALYEQGYRGVYTKDNSAALAICRAALYVVNAKAEHDVQV